MNCQIIKSNCNITPLIFVFIISFSSLMIQRIGTNKKNRISIVFLYDIIKLFFGFLFSYFLDIYLILINDEKNQCYNYLILNITNLILCSFLQISLLKMLNYFFKNKNFIFLISGNYSIYSTILNSEYLIQLFIWVSIVIVTKLIIYYCLILPLNKDMVYISVGILNLFSKKEIVMHYLTSIILNLLTNIPYLWLNDRYIRGIGISKEVNFLDLNDDNIYNEF